MPTGGLDESDVRDRLRAVEDPVLGDDIVVDAGTVHLSFVLGASHSPTETGIANEVPEVLADTDIDVDLSAEFEREFDQTTGSPTRQAHPYTEEMKSAIASVVATVHIAGLFINVRS